MELNKSCEINKVGKTTDIHGETTNPAITYIQVVVSTEKFR